MARELHGCLKHGNIHQSEPEVKLMNFFKKARLFFLKSCLGVLVLGLTAVAQATPLRLDYSVTDLGGGLYDYNFILVLDNNDSSWAAGQNFNWIIWGLA